MTRIDDLLLEHVQRLLDEDAISDEELIRQYPELMPELGEQLRMLPGLRDELPTTESQDASDVLSARDSGLITVCCPQCHEAVRVPADAVLADITCSVCGSQFSLVGDSAQALAATTGEHLGRFELIERLGMGHFGTVWKAQDTQLDRIVAVKIPRQGRFESGEVHQFLREARAAAQLNHPNIVRVYEVGRDQDTVYIVSDIVQGVPLSDWLKGHRITFRKSAELCAKIATALDHAHEAGVIHRDLKPQNIMMACSETIHPVDRRPRKTSSSDSGNDEPVIMDFGLARREAGEVTMTLDGHVLGTPAYMSPEQARGEAHQADGRTDIYSLGVILFELLTGELPFRGTTRMLLHHVLHDEARHPRSLNDRIPKDLETICLKAMAKEPTRRYQRAQGMADDLRRFVRGEAIQARPISTLARTWRWSRRNPMTATVMGLVLCLAIVGPLVAIRQSRLADDEAKARRQAILAQKSERQLAFSLALDRGLTLCDKGDVSLGMLWLSRALELASDQTTEIRRVIRANLAAWGQQLNSLEAIFAHDRGVLAVAFSPDGDVILTAGDDHTARLWEARTGSRIATLLHNGRIHEVAFSPDGSRVLTASFDNTARLWNWRSGKELHTFHHQGVVEGAAFVHGTDGMRIVTSSSDRTIKIWDANSGQQVDVLTGHQHLVHDVAVSRDGTQVVTASYDKTARLWDLETRQAIAVFPHHSRVPTVDFRTTDGSQIVTGDIDGNVFLWDAVTQEIIGGPWRHQGGIHRLRVSPDGSRILTASRDNMARLWDPDNGAEVGAPFKHQAAANGVAFGPHGLILTACDDNAARLWRPAAGGSPRSTFKHEGLERQEAVFTSDARYILTGTENETVSVRDAATGAPIGVPLRQSGGVLAVAVSPDGSKILTGNSANRAQLWETVSGRAIGEFRHAGPVWTVAFSPNGDRMLTGSFVGTVRLWDVATGAPFGEPLELGVPIWGTTFSPDGSRFAVASADKMARLVDVNTGKVIHACVGHRSPVWGVAFSPDGTRMVTGSHDNTVRVWDVATGELLSAPMPHSGPIWHAVAFSPDGQTIVTGCDDRNARIWDVATAKPIGPAFPHEAAVRIAIFTRDGSQIFTGTADGTVKVWGASISPVVDDVHRITLWVQVLTGFELDEDGTLLVLDAQSWQHRRRRLRALGGPPRMAAAAISRGGLSQGE